MLTLLPPFDTGELLEAKNVSWKVYQQTDNFDDNAFAW